MVDLETSLHLIRNKETDKPTVVRFHHWNVHGYRLGIRQCHVRYHHWYVLTACHKSMFPFLFLF